jgi:hypothetical protein
MLNNWSGQFSTHRTPDPDTFMYGATISSCMPLVLPNVANDTERDIISDGHLREDHKQRTRAILIWVLC